MVNDKDNDATQQLNGNENGQGGEPLDEKPESETAPPDDDLKPEHQTISNASCIVTVSPAGISPILT